MKVKLLKPFLSRTKGSIITMHPVNARKYAQLGFCEALTDEEQEYLMKGVAGRGKVVETQIRSKATETTTVTPDAGTKPKGRLVRRKKTKK